MCLSAVACFEKPARLGNVHAQYMLGKIYLDANSGHENAEKAVLWLTKAADNSSSLARYALAGGSVVALGEVLFILLLRL